MSDVLPTLKLKKNHKQKSTRKVGKTDSDTYTSEELACCEEQGTALTTESSQQSFQYYSFKAALPSGIKIQDTEVD